MSGPLDSLRRVNDYIAAEMDAAPPAVIVAYCETSAGGTVELTLSDRVSVAYMAGGSR